VSRGALRAFLSLCRPAELVGIYTEYMVTITIVRGRLHCESDMLDARTAAVAAIAPAHASQRSAPSGRCCRADGSRLALPEARLTTIAPRVDSDQS
jgi:hypothetical protein